MTDFQSLNKSNKLQTKPKCSHVLVFEGATRTGARCTRPKDVDDDDDDDDDDDPDPGMTTTGNRA